MSYEPTNWKDGDLVTSAKLNKLEQGVAASGSGGITFVEADETGRTLNKTWQEIYDAAKSGIVYLKMIIEGTPNFLQPQGDTIGDTLNIEIHSVTICPLINIHHSSQISIYSIEFYETPDSMIFQAESADDYPTLQTEPLSA